MAKSLKIIKPSIIPVFPLDVLDSWNWADEPWEEYVDMLDVYPGHEYRSEYYPKIVALHRVICDQIWEANLVSQAGSEWQPRELLNILQVAEPAVMEIRNLVKKDMNVRGIDSACDLYLYACSTLEALLGNTKVAAKGYDSLLGHMDHDYYWPDFEEALQILSRINLGVLLLNYKTREAYERALRLFDFEVPTPSELDDALEWENNIIHYYALAQCNLAYMHYYGMGVTKDRSKALKLYVDTSHLAPIALFNIGVICYKGDKTNGYPPNYEKAVEYFQQAVESGISDAKQALEYAQPRMHEEQRFVGKGPNTIPKNILEGEMNPLDLSPLQVDISKYDSDYEKTLEWLLLQVKRLAIIKASSNSPMTHKGLLHIPLDLGYLHAYGMGVRKNRKKAIQYYELAAALNITEGYLNLAKLALKMSGSENRQRAVGYLVIAKKFGSEEVEEQLRLLEVLVPRGEIEKGKSLIDKIQNELAHTVVKFFPSCPPTDA